MNTFLALIRRELALSWRQNTDTLATVGFFLLAGALFPLALGPSPALLARLGPGIASVLALLAALLPLDRLFAADAEDGALDLLLLSGLPPAALALAKAIGHWLTTGLPLLAASLPLAISYGVPPRADATLLAALAGETAILSLLGTLGAAVVVGARRGALLLPILVLPLAAPALIFGAAAIDDAAAALPGRGALFLLAALLALALPLCPLAAGAALRAAAE